MQLCPKCDHTLDDAAVLCACCDHILDEEFFTDDLTDMNEVTAPGMRTLPPHKTDEGMALPPRSVEQGDPVILGDVSGEFDVVLTEETGSYLHAASEMSDDSGPMRAAPVYVSASTAELTEPTAVLVARDDVELPALTPFEAHVRSLLDGRRSVEEVRALSALSLEDLRIALCMLGDKGLVQVKLPLPVEERPEPTDPSAAPPFAVLEVLRELSLSSSVPENEPVEMDAAALELMPLAAAAPAHEPEPEPEPVRARPSPADKQKAASVYELALRDINAGRFARARQYVKLAVSLDPAEARYQALLEEWDKAREVAAAVEEPPAVKLAQRATDAERARDFVGAARLLDEAIALEPDDAALHNRVGVLCATRLKDFDRGTHALFRAVELAPGNATFRHNLLKVMGAAEAARDARLGTSGKASATDDGRPSGFKALLRKKLF